MKRLVLMIVPALICGMVLAGCGSEVATDDNTKDNGVKEETVVTPNDNGTEPAGGETDEDATTGGETVATPDDNVTEPVGGETDEDASIVEDGDNNGSLDFYDLEYRIGIWVNPERQDTLEFVNSSKLTRKGLHFQLHEYFYRVENDTLIVSLPDYEDSETYHPILKAEKKTVVLGNMYIVLMHAVGGIVDNSGTFIKE